MNAAAHDAGARGRDEQAGFARALLDPALPAPAGLRTWNGSAAARRFAVHRNNVVVSLVEALADTFAVVQQLVGETFFRAMAREFVLRRPPRSPMLFEYGDGFAEFIDGFGPAAGLPYLSDVARLEYVRMQALHAADAEPLGAEAFAAALADAARLPALSVRLHPAVRLLRLRHAAVSLWAAHHGHGEIAEIDWRAAEDALIARPALEVEIRRLPRGAWAFLRALADARTLGEALGAARADDDAFEPAAALDILVHAGIAVALEPMQ